MRVSIFNGKGAGVEGSGTGERRIAAIAFFSAEESLLRPDGPQEPRNDARRTDGPDAHYGMP